MLRRIRYASRFADVMSPTDIAALVTAAAAHNAQHDITGVLIATGEMFFQVIEGPADEIDALYQRIRHDPRHQDVVLLDMEESADLTRLYPDWAMRRLDLSAEAVNEFGPLRALLSSIHALSRQVITLRRTLEHAAWNVLVQAEIDALDDPSA